MKRYVLISLGIGVLIALVVLILYFLRVFELPGAWLNQVFTSRGIYPSGMTPDRLVWAEVSVIAMMAIWICWCLSDLSQVSQKLIIGVIFAIIVFGISPSLALYGIFFEPFSSVSAVILAALASLGLAGSELGKRKRTLEMVLGRRVSQQTFNELMEAPKPPVFEGHTKDVTILTCRIFNRTELVESLPPADFLKMTNLFRRVISGFLATKGAYLDEAGPELIRAHFGLLRSDTDHAGKAIRAALDLRAALKTLNQECLGRWNEELRAGVGISSGEVVAGIYGSKEHFFLSGIGPEVDFSRRLSKANVQYGSDLLIGPKTFVLVQEMVEVRPMEMFYDPETGSMTEIYQLLALKEDFGENNRQLRDHYWQGVILFREKKYLEAIESFSKARIPGKDDGPLEYFISRVQEKLSESRSENESKSQLTGEGHSRLLGNL
ncbi:MAG: adenylate/guanylate cyclase domain-containing protein [Verrucomicrobiales bacterium]|nr:adenylate/guanylate cyclase domain-containing protein [Verrucomicrobiales bacterium]